MGNKGRAKTTDPRLPGKHEVSSPLSGGRCVLIHSLILASFLGRRFQHVLLLPQKQAKTRKLNLGFCPEGLWGLTDACAPAERCLAS